MADPVQPQDPMEFLKTMWGSMGFALPGMVAPTLDVDDVDRRIAELKAVEGWLKLNLGMLQMSIQGMEMQRATLAAMQTLGQAGAGAQANPFTDAGTWPWNFLHSTPEPEAAGETAPPAAEPAKKKK